MKHKKRSKGKKPDSFFIVAIVILILAIVVSFFYIGESNSLNSNMRSVIVNGDSMEPLITEGTEVYYDTDGFSEEGPQRGDIVLYNFTGNQNLIIKKIMGVSGDTIKYNENRIYINEEVLKNSAGEEYRISSEMLALYASSYPTLPDDTYLILGDNPSGSTDSSEFGLVARKDITAKVFIN